MTDPSAEDVIAELRTLHDELRRYEPSGAARWLIKVWADRLAALVERVSRQRQEEKELALMREAARDASLSDGAFRALAASELQEPTADDLAWAASVTRQQEPPKEPK